MTQKSKKNKKGQTMVEYIIIIAVIAISLIAIFSYFSKGVGKKVVAATDALDTNMGQKAREALDSIPDPENPKPLKEMGN